MHSGVPNSHIWNGQKVKRETIQLYSITLKENKINFKLLGNLTHPLWFFFTLLPSLALPESDLYHYEEFSVQAEIIAKNALSSTSHNVVSSKELGA